MQLRDKELRGRMEEEDVEALTELLDSMDAWTDRAEDESPAAFEDKLAELTDRADALLGKYGAALDGGTAGGGIDPLEDDLGVEGDHDEL